MSSNSKKNKDLKWKVADILGFEVFDQNGDLLGILVDVLATATNDIWTIKSEDEEILIPALKSIVTKVDISEKRIFVSLPDGYTDTYGTKIKLEDAISVDEYNPGITVYED